MFAGVTGHVVTTAIEHIAVLAAARLHEHSLVAVDSTGRVKAADVRAAIREDTVLVSISLASEGKKGK
jgi:cysteine desulfurase